MRFQSLRKIIQFASSERYNGGMSEFIIGENTLTLAGPAGKLEASLHLPESLQPERLAIICHPHPLHQGTMNNKVVTTLARAYEQLGIASLRFNYRGVGQSEGDYGHMTGEIEDLFAVLGWVQQQWPQVKLYLAGFSFGAFIAASVANQWDVESLVTVAPAVNHADFSGLKRIHCPWLVITGDQDEVVPFAEVKDFCDNPPSPLELVVFENCGHFFHGRLIDLRDRVRGDVFQII